jgi:Outer membrane protein beta-barrel domain
MQHVDQNMDDLFRNAAENYQLKAGHDWDKIAPFLTGSATPSAAAVMPKNKKPWLILAILLMLSPLLLITLNIEKPIPGAQSAGLNIPDRKTTDHNTSPVNSIQKQTTKNPNHLPDKNNRLTPEKDPEQIELAERSSISSIPDAAGSNAKTNSTAINHVAAHSALDPDQPIAEILATNLPVQSTYSTIKPEVQTQTKISATIKHWTNTENEPAAAIPVKRSPQNHGFYLGLAAGPQWNQVEGQGYNKTGFNVGLIAGFSFNKKLAVESGISYSKKYYYSDGQYFHMKKNPGTPTMKVISLEGSSNVIEIPAKIKYDVIDNKKGELFIIAGLSTYILTKENNQYYALINGTPQNSTVIYNDRKTYLAGGMNLSAGYSIHLKKKTDIRIEPYLQIPFKGTGVGSMRVTTSGLNIGITRNLHK